MASKPSILLSTGNVLIAGETNRAELFDPNNKDFSIVKGAFPSQRRFACAMLLGNDNILITGGDDENINPGGEAYLFTSSKK